jgi:hypothetical protein
MASYLILGAGKFGRLAVQRLTAQDAAARLAVVDRDPGALAALPTLNGVRVETIAADLAAFLKDRLPHYASWDWLIPAMPVHVALVSLEQGPLAGSGWELLEAPAEAANLAATAIRGPGGGLYLSRATHLCPDDCPEPEDFCPVTGESRTPPLYEALAGLSLPGFRVLVIPSRPLAPGVGGYPPRALLDLARALDDVHENLLIATACRCHGVVHALRRRRERF